MATDYRRQAIRGSAPLFVAAVVVLALGYAGVEPTTRLFGAFAALAAVLLAGWYALDRPWYLAGVWVVPATLAAVMILSGDASASELRTVGGVLAVLSPVTVVISPATAYFAQAGESVGNRLIEKE
jgi:hypothetical protein